MTKKRTNTNSDINQSGGGSQKNSKGQTSVAKNNNNNSWKNQTKPNNRKPQSSQKPSKKTIEKEQEEQAQKNLQDLDYQIRIHERNKKSSGKGINQTTTLIKTSLQTLIEIPDFDKYWVKEITFLQFLPVDNSGETDTIQFLNIDLSWLLKLPFHQFWSQISFDSSFSSSLESFLRFTCRNHDNKILHALAKNEPHPFFSHPGLKMLYKRFFCVLERMSHWEEGTNNIQTSFYANLIYKKKLFDIPRILDIASLYGHSNPQMVSQMFTRLFSVQENLLSDLKSNSIHIINSLQNTQRQIKSAISKNSPDLEDLFAYYIDLLVSISSLLLLFPESSHSFIDKALKDPFYTIIQKSFDDLLPLIRKSSIASSPIWNLQIEIVEKSMINIIWVIFNHCHISLLIDKISATGSCKSCHNNPDLSSRLSELFDFLIQNIQELDDAQEVSHDFIKKIGKDFPLQNRLHEIFVFSNYEKIDKSQFKFIMEGLKNIVGNFVPRIQVDTKEVFIENKINSQLQKYIEQVKEMFGDLEDGFVEALLKRFNFNVEKVIHKLLENQIPDDLLKLKNSKASNPLQERKSIYDADEFDIKTNELLESDLILRGNKSAKKKEMEEILSERLDFSQYRDYMYEDEYDDSLEAFAGRSELVTSQEREVEPETILDDSKETENEKENENENENINSSNNNSNKKNINKPSNLITYQGPLGIGRGKNTNINQNLNQRPSRGRGKGSHDKHHGAKQASVKKHNKFFNG